MTAPDDGITPATLADGSRIAAAAAATAPSPSTPPPPSLAAGDLPDGLPDELLSDDLPDELPDDPDLRRFAAELGGLWQQVSGWTAPLDETASRELHDLMDAVRRQNVAAGLAVTSVCAHARDLSALRAGWPHFSPGQKAVLNAATAYVLEAERTASRPDETAAGATTAAVVEATVAEAAPWAALTGREAGPTAAGPTRTPPRAPTPVSTGAAASQDTGTVADDVARVVGAAVRAVLHRR